LFQQLISAFKDKDLFFHLNNTGGVVSVGPDHYSFARIGIGLYGYWPGKQFNDQTISNTYPVKPLKPVLSWKTGISDIRWLSKGESLGYRRAYVAESEMKIGLAPVGYADGYPFALSNKGKVLIGDEQCNVLGQVNMNYLSIDITGLENVKVGEPVVLLGKMGNRSISLEDWRCWSEGFLFPYESMCNLRNK
jgi:alanine racemase